MRSNRRLRAYVAATVLLGAVALAFVPPEGVGQRPWALAVLLGLIVLISSLPVQIRTLKLEITATHPITVALLGVAGGWGIVGGSILTVLTAWFAKRLRGNRASWDRFLFNLGSHTWVAVVAALAFVAAGGDPAEPVRSMLGPLALASAAFFMLNTLTVSFAVALEKRKSIWEIWKDSFLWTTASYLTGFTIAVLLLMLLSAVGPWGLALAIPPCWMMLAFYKTHRARLREHEERIAEVEELNAALEHKVRERTVELREALETVESTNTELTRANTRLHAAHRAKSEFLANMTHELRTPLNSVIGFSELMEDRSTGPLNERQRELIEDIRGSGEHLLGLINDILDLAKLDASKMEVHRGDMSVEVEVQKCLGIVRPLARKKSIRLSSSLDPGIGIAFLDAGMFRGALVNLLSNAVKFTPAEGRVEVTVSTDGETGMTVAVRDTGIGISEEHQQKIFDEFFQADGGFSREYQGTGLGLALVQRMVEMHGGDVTVSSVEGEGSTFVCRYPDCRTETCASSGEPTDPAESSGGEFARAGAPRKELRPEESTVFLLEPRTLDRQLIRNVLRSRGYAVETFSGTDELDAALERRRPELLLISMDADAGGIDWWERRIRDPRHGGLPAIGLTSHADLEFPRFTQSGGLGLIGKPIRLAAFPGQLQALWSGEEKEEVA